MSIATMTRLAAPAALRPALDAAQPPVSDIQETALEKITAFIPTEVIGIYVAGLGILSGTDETAPGDGTGVGWALFAFCLLVVPLLVAINVQLRNRASGTEGTVGPRKALLLCVFGAVAFIAWTAALPETPFVDLHAYANRIGAFAVVVLGVLMPGVAQLLGLVPRG